ncbi:hypothetical protein LIN78_02075 [Leeia sp. TBRC 13508]|uniref:Uncharacterized protein n=1 Tax=Leeia speluncae TaxID=2884804 RepID=A0ABS8D2C1_9NEIS|nr:hypothetical protein [Leeia speluncae]MCB6182342.1 hypothetical protein [Leeia speluncae]
MPVELTDEQKQLLQQQAAAYREENGCSLKEARESVWKRYLASLEQPVTKEPQPKPVAQAPPVKQVVKAQQGSKRTFNATPAVESALAGCYRILKGKNDERSTSS